MRRKLEVRYFDCVDRAVLELGDDTDRSSDAGSTSSRTKKRKKTIRKKNLIEVDSGDDEKPKKKKTKTIEKTKPKKGKRKGFFTLFKLKKIIFTFVCLWC